MSPGSNVTEFSPDPLADDRSRKTSNGNGGGIGERLRQVELDVRELKTDMKHVATKSWILGGILGGMGVAALVALGIARLMSSN